MIDSSMFKAYLLTNYPAELAAGADGSIFAAMQAIAAETVTGSVSRARFIVWAASTGMRAVIEDLANDAQSPLRASALALRDLVQGASDALHLSDPTNLALLGAWEAAGALSAANKASLLALAQTPQTVAERDGFAGLAFGDIVEARTRA